MMISGPTTIPKVKKTRGSTETPVMKIMSIQRPLRKKNSKPLRSNGSLTLWSKREEDGSKDGTEASTKITTGSYNQSALTESPYLKSTT